MIEAYILHPCLTFTLLCCHEGTRYKVCPPPIQDTNLSRNEFSPVSESYRSIATILCSCFPVFYCIHTLIDSKSSFDNASNPKCLEVLFRCLRVLFYALFSSSSRVMSFKTIFTAFCTYKLSSSTISSKGATDLGVPKVPKVSAAHFLTYQLES